jgi:DNA-binding CsgD family transcriptional regulator
VLPPDRARRVSLCEEAEEIVRSTGDRLGLALVLGARSIALWDVSTVDVRLGLADELAGLAGELGNTEAALESRLYSAYAFVESGEVSRARLELLAAELLADRLHQPYHQYLARMADSMFRIMEDPAAGEAAALSTLERGQRIDHQDALAAYTVQLLVVRWDQGRCAELIPHLRAFFEHQGLPAWRIALAMAYLEVGDVDSARTHYEQLAATNFDLPTDRAWAAAMSVIAELCSAFDDRARAGILYDRMLPFGQRVSLVAGGAACIGSMERALGLLAATLGHLNDARRHFERAIDANERIGARSFVVRTQRNYAAMLIRSRNEKDKLAARRMAKEARDRAVALGMAGEVTRLDALIEVMPPANATSGLTGRELEVLRLVASGASNQEIAEQLAIGLKTVERHLANSYAKIGARSRVDAATFVLRHGLD